MTLHTEIPPRYADAAMVAKLKEANPLFHYRTWDEVSAATKKATAFFCCYPGCWRVGCAAHHVAYQDSRGALVGREIEGVNVFWLCKVHHSRKNKQGAHHPLNWFPGKYPNEARNFTDYYLLLRQGYQEKRQWMNNNKDWSKARKKCLPRSSKVGQAKKRCSSGSKTS